MKIELSKIHPSPKPIRSTWDEEKMKDLSWSLREEGQVEPIGVHENSHGYVIVWGHRRVEAARRAQWTEIDAVVVPQDEINNLIQAGIENLSSEEMLIPDKADWAQRLVELGISIREISRRSSVNNSLISSWLLYKREKAAGVEVRARTHSSQDEGFRKTVEIARALGDDLEAKKFVAAKASEDRLTDFQTRAVADAYRDAPTPEVKAQVLKTPIISRDTAADILRRSINRVEMETGRKIQQERNVWENERDEKRMVDNWDYPVKDFLASVKLFSEALHKNAAAVRSGSYSPEALAFTIRKVDRLLDDLKTHWEMLEDAS